MKKPTVDETTLARRVRKLSAENRKLRSRNRIAEDEIDRLSQYDPLRPGARPVSPLQAGQGE